MSPCPTWVRFHIVKERTDSCRLSSDHYISIIACLLPTYTCMHTYIQKCRKFKLQYWPSTGKKRENYCEKWLGIVINFNIHLTYVLEISILDIYTMKMKHYIHTKACMQVFIAALFITTQIYIQSKYSLRNAWMNELFRYP